MHSIRRSCLALLLALLCMPTLALAQSGGWSLDPGVFASGQDLLQRTPTREMNDLFQAVPELVKRQNNRYSL